MVWDEPEYGFFKEIVRGLPPNLKPKIFTLRKF